MMDSMTLKYQPRSKEIKKVKRYYLEPSLADLISQRAQENGVSDSAYVTAALKRAEGVQDQEAIDLKRAS